MFPYYYCVNEDCIACDTCVTLAKAHFALTADQSHAYVHHQPESETDDLDCQKALNDCPVEAIERQAAPPTPQAGNP